MSLLLSWSTSKTTISNKKYKSKAFNNPWWRCSANRFCLSSSSSMGMLSIITLELPNSNNRHSNKHSSSLQTTSLPWSSRWFSHSSLFRTVTLHCHQPKIRTEILVVLLTRPSRLQQALWLLRRRAIPTTSPLTKSNFSRSYLKGSSNHYKYNNSSKVLLSNNRPQILLSSKMLICWTNKTVGIAMPILEPCCKTSWWTRPHKLNSHKILLPPTTLLEAQWKTWDKLRLPIISQGPIQLFHSFSSWMLLSTTQHLWPLTKGKIQPSVII